jgi:hypothetical protein
MLAALAARRPDADPAALLPVGADGLRDFLCRYVDAGVSKFVVRAAGGVTTWEDELSWLADVVLPLQT